MSPPSISTGDLTDSVVVTNVSTDSNFSCSLSARRPRVGSPCRPRCDSPNGISLSEEWGGGYYYAIYVFAIRRRGLPSFTFSLAL